MNFKSFITGVGDAFVWVGNSILWPATKAIFGLLWELFCLILRPSAKSAGEGISKAIPFLLVVGVVTGGLYGLLHAPQHLQDQGVAIIALVTFCLMLWGVFKPSKKKAGLPPRHRERDRG